MSLFKMSSHFVTHEIKNNEYKIGVVKTISLKQFHTLLKESFAVVLKKDDIYKINWEDGDPHLYSDKDYYTYDLSGVDGDIWIDNDSVVFYLAAQPIFLRFLTIRNFTIEEIVNMEADSDD